MPSYLSLTELQKTLNKQKKRGEHIGLVPTMGALHNGHLSLICKSVAENDQTWVTIFVNPTQFDDQNDLMNYPKTTNQDLELIYSISKNINVFIPDVKTMYADHEKLPHYDFQGLDMMMEGQSRKDHFQGVGHIVGKFFDLFMPHRAYFGEKDYQQLQIIKKLVAIKKYPVQIIPCPILREESGLAMSSRNQRLTQHNRKQAKIIYQLLQHSIQLLHTSTPNEIKKQITKQLNKVEGFRLDYFEIADAKSLQISQKLNPNTKYRAFIAVHVQGIRLIDNMALN